jgi:hypothetical protein
MQNRKKLKVEEEELKEKNQGCLFLFSSDCNGIFKVFGVFGQD